MCRIVCRLAVFAAFAVVAALAHVIPPPGVAIAQDGAPPPAPKPCTSEEYRQLDFWIGTWEVRNQLRPQPSASTNRITAEEGGCVIVERYTTPVGYSGRSLSFYDAARDRWHQTWIDSRGQALYLDGRFRDGALVLSGGSANGALNRISWRPLDGGNVQQLWEVSKDGGETWTTAFDGLYSPKRE